MAGEIRDILGIRRRFKRLAWTTTAGEPLEEMKKAGQIALDDGDDDKGEEEHGRIVRQTSLGISRATDQRPSSSSHQFITGAISVRPHSRINAGWKIRP
jgi:hypothetical protein